MKALRRGLHELGMGELFISPRKQRICFCPTKLVSNKFQLNTYNIKELVHLFYLLKSQMTILPFGQNASRLMSIPTKIDVLNVVVTFVSSNSLPKVNFDFLLEKVNRLTFDQKVNPDTFCDDSRF